MTSDQQQEQSSESRAHELALTLYHAAVAAVDPSDVTSAAVEALRIATDRRVWLYAFGKAATSMARAATATLLRSRNSIAGGVVVDQHEAAAPFPTLSVVCGDHPIPGRHSFAAAARIGDASAGRVSNDVVLVLVSGGTSSLIGAPLRGMAEADLTGLYEMLLGSGLDIHEMNAIRKRFSRWAAGRLALSLAPSAIHCLAISDVPGDELEVIGSGPCVPDPTTAGDVLDILRKARLEDRLSAEQQQYLKSVAQGTTPETPKRNHPAFAHVTARVIGSNDLALRGALERARTLGVSPEIGSEPLRGDAAEEGRRLARRLIEARGQNARVPRCLLWGGETTVTLSPGQDQRGGGRSQELALAAARELDAAGDDARGIVLLAAGTDGRDGATNAAGACVDASTWGAIARAGRDPGAALSRHESNGALASAGAHTLIPAAPTGTNVSDVAIGVIV